jgi:hypothetical protein
LSENISLPVQSGFTPISGYGIAISQDNISIIPSTPVSVDDSRVARLDFNLPKGTISYAGIIKDSGNNFVASPLKNTTSPILPICKEQIDQKGAAANQTSLLQSLIQIRVEKRALMKKRVEDALDATLLEKLNKLENAFGLSPDIPLSADIDPYTLSERLSLLAVVLGNLEEQK